MNNPGYTEVFEQFRKDHNLSDFDFGRVVSEHKERYIVKTNEGEFEAEISGALRFSANRREDYPAVGDWVAITIYDSDNGIIHKVYPRYSLIKRQAVGRFGEIQIIAANIDYALLVQAADRDFNINRLERYLTICNESRVRPIIILTKTDLITDEDVSEIKEAICKRIQDIPVIALSNESHAGIPDLIRIIEPGKTYCMLGSSGVGKSSLINTLSGKSVMRTDAISDHTHKGRHVTSHRELSVLENGGIFIDNPGMREVGIADTGGGLEQTFDTIVRLGKACRFKDCTHTQEHGCAVLLAVEKGELDPASYENYLKMEREKAHFETTIVEKRNKDKQFGKLLKNYKKDLDIF